ncbi:GcvT family protein [Streptomonospora litoralis]|uniref:4-methylaminobutanoate oxidase (Formaldehyde-forming) n=1 Tax=Streptomonospora litoralis TaxID=2498135 RepID=A0A4V0ZJZ3_9ACTN|nr:FAD-dependent oxidoreductase [Streptomonospora litoralis]QBI55182.1 4-methylaminobutanoate oxidase (formaldehyde-forming) [Streptomonospora litoralis]
MSTAAAAGPPPRTHRSAHPRVVVIGAGIVGCALADELTSRGWRDVTVLDQGPLFATGGSSSHAPGLVFQTNPSKTMTAFAAYTVDKFSRLSLDGRWCFRAVGGLEVAATRQRWHDLERKLGLARCWGVRAELVDARECARMWPMLDPERVYGGLYTPDDGLAKAVRAGEAQARAAMARGASFLAHHTVVGIERDGGRVTGVVTDRGTFPADIAVSAAGFWGPAVGRMAGVEVPLLPMAHQYAYTAPVEGVDNPPELEASRPLLRHQDRDLYFREHTDRIGIGSYAHRPLPVRLEDVAEYDRAAVMPSMLEFTAADFEPSWQDSVELLPALADSKVEEGFNGVFSFTPDGMPLLGESRRLPGFWLAEAVWVTHSAGAAKAVAEWMTEGRTETDVHECDVHRFEDAQLSPAYVSDRGKQSFVEVYDVVHPLQPMEHPRPLRTSPFFARQRELGAFFLEGGGWERPYWYGANEPLVEAADEGRGRDPWSARYWSPIVGAEARATREGVALYDMTPLKRLEVAGPGALAFLQHATTNQIDRKPGTVAYTLLLDPGGGVRSDLTVARLDEDAFQVGVSSNLDVDWLRTHLPADGSVVLREITAGTCCIGVWGPLARDLVQPLSGDDLSHTGFGFFKARRVHIGHVPVLAMRVSYVGELGWELYTDADLGLRLWDTLWEAGRGLGAVAAGRAAFNSLRLEKGYRLAGTDMTSEHDPYEAGLGFAVKLEKGEFIGRDAAAAAAERAPRRRLGCLTLDDPDRVVMGREPVLVDGRPAGYVTSAGYSTTLGRGVAYAWLPAEAADPGTGVAVEYFGEPLAATVAAEPLVDPEMARIRR